MRLAVSEIKTWAGKVKTLDSDPKSWAIFERQKAIHKHLDEHGMINPIIINSNKELQVGACRLQYAILKRWQYINVIICDDPVEILSLQDMQANYEHTFLPQNLIERHKLVSGVKM